MSTTITTPRNVGAFEFELDTVDLARPHGHDGLTGPEVAQVYGGAAVARATGSVGAYVELRDVVAHATRIPSPQGARYRVTFRELEDDCAACAAPEGRACVHWCPRTRTAEELDALAHVHVETSSRDCDGSYSHSYVIADEELCAADVLARAVRLVVSPSAEDGELRIRQEPALDWYGGHAPHELTLPTAEWSERTEEGGRHAALTLCYREGCE